MLRDTLKQEIDQLTLNPNDFSDISGVTVVDPRKIVESASNL
ncbi:hypothetical protein [Nostoc sp. UHCC 0870]